MTDPTTPLFLVVTIYPKIDKLAEAEAQLHRMRAASQAEDGCDFMHLTQTIDGDGDVWVMIEVRLAGRLGRAHGVGAQPARQRRARASVAPALGPPAVPREATGPLVRNADRGLARDRCSH